MPELPEVQTIVDDLRKKIIGRRIVGVWFDAPALIKKPKPKDLRFKIKDLRITEIKRRGKNILIYL
ncbi:formamidopyrimidine-DNA glycosylase, partial [Candidatus Wolfebacteria bacterium]|nr:formamidopyrimidine-DNA glycosylase [Candidatus Wolfebacteria bacterium]